MFAPALCIHCIKQTFITPVKKIQKQNKSEDSDNQRSFVSKLALWHIPKHTALSITPFTHHGRLDKSHSRAKATPERLYMYKLKRN